MFQRILVPLDGATRAERALPVAARIARATGGSIVLLRVVYAPSESDVLTYSPAVPTPVDLEAEITAADTYLSSIAASDVLEGIGTHVEVTTGPAATAILSSIEANSIDLVVIASHGETGLKRWLLGSVAQKVARHSSVPVFILRDQGPTPVIEETIRPVKALVALDGSPMAEAVLAPVVQIVAILSAPAQGTLHLTRVITMPTYGRMHSHLDVQAIEHAEKSVQAYLYEVTERLQREFAHLHLIINTYAPVEMDVAATLVRIAENEQGANCFGDCDLIAIATHGRSGLQRWALGSVAERVLESTQLPLLIVQSGKVLAEQKEAIAQSVSAK